jgi:hypothetical protein
VAFITLTLFFRSLSPSASSELCDTDGLCPVGSAPPSDPKPPSKQDILTLQQQIHEIKEDIEKLKTKPTPKVLSPEEQQWLDRRQECNDNVIRNIDYQHVPNPFHILVLLPHGSLDLLSSCS